MYISGYAPLNQAARRSGRTDAELHLRGFSELVEGPARLEVRRRGDGHSAGSAVLSPEGTFGNFSFDGRFTGNAYADFLLGLPGDQFAHSTR